MVIALQILVSAFVSACFASVFTVFLLADRLGKRVPYAPGERERTAPEPITEQAKLRSPVYPTPEKAARAEAGRTMNLPPQWKKVL